MQPNSYRKPRPFQYQNIYEVVCAVCGGFIGFNRDMFRKETDAKGKTRYFHIPSCPKKEDTRPKA